MRAGRPLPEAVSAVVIPSKALSLGRSLAVFADLGWRENPSTKNRYGPLSRATHQHEAEIVQCAFCRFLSRLTMRTVPRAKFSKQRSGSALPDGSIREALIRLRP